MNKLPMLALADLEGDNENQVRAYLVREFQPPADALDDIHIIVAYSSVGSWGCDSSAFIIFKKDGRLYEVNGSHCSCMGFEGQWDPEEVPDLAAILKREDYALAGGGYDNDSKANAEAIRTHLKSLFWSPPNTDVSPSFRSELEKALEQYNYGSADLYNAVRTLLDRTE